MTAVARMPAAEAPSRVPPHSHEAEMMCVGHCLRGAVDEIADLIRPDHFTEPGLRRLYETCLALSADGRKVDPVSVSEALRGDAELDRLGGASFIARLALDTFGAPWARQHAAIVLDAWRRREFIAAAERAVGEAHDPPVDLATGMPRTGEAIAAALDLRILELTGGDGASEPVAYRDAVEAAVERVDRARRAGTHITGVPSGLADLDHALGGWQAPDLIVVAGRPGMGKTAFAWGAARQAAYSGHPVAFFSLEMSAEQLAARDLASETGVSSDRQRRGAVSDAEINDIVLAGGRVSGLPIHIDDSPAASVARLRARARRLQRRHGLGLIVVDYIQLMVAPERAENRTQEVSRITRDLKVMAKDLGVPVIALSQLSREVEKRDDKRPLLSDLRESGSIEQDADVVIFLYRHEYYLGDSPPPKRTSERAEAYNARVSEWHAERDKCANVAEAHVAKNRHGPERRIELHWDGERTRFGSLTRATDER